MKRLSKSIITGAILGVFCIIGISLRMGYVGNEFFILITYLNRLLMGFVVGLADNLKLTKKYNSLFRGAFIGLIISGTLYLNTNFYDTPGFIAGIVYGIIIDYVASKK